MSEITTTKAYTVGENDSNSSKTFCYSDPYVTADTYRKCAAQQQQEQQQIETSTPTTAAAAAVHRRDIQNRVYYVNDRPYMPQWRVEIVKDASLHENSCRNHQNNKKNDATNHVEHETTVDDPYIAVKSIAAAIMLLQQPHLPVPLTTTTSSSSSSSTPEMVLHHHHVEPDIWGIMHTMTQHLSVERVMGGVTNTLYKVAGFQTVASSLLSSSSIQELTTWVSPDSDNVLVRIFGAEGLIDRDDETGVFAALSQSHLAPAYYGRFQNGRVEGYQEGMRPLQFHELSTGPTSIAKGIATNLARLHYGFRILPTLSVERRQPTLWKQLFDWLDQAEVAKFELEADRQVVSNLQLPTLRPELLWLQEEIEKIIDWNSDPIVFCHNDLLAANILYNDVTETIQLIDFEYGGINYRAFDIANHFNEYAGGPPTDVRPDYNLLPTEPQQRYFIRTYLETAAETKSIPAPKDTPRTNGATHHSTTTQQVGSTIEEYRIDAMMKEVEIFLIINHLYWGLWGINQASIEGCAVYDYMTYGVNRIQQYWIQRRKIR